MPIESEFTTELGAELQLQLDAIGEALKSQIGWPPLGVETLTPSGLRAQDHKKAQELGDYLTQLGEQGAREMLQASGQQIIDSMGAQVLQEAVQVANAEWLHQRGNDGRETVI